MRQMRGWNGERSQCTEPIVLGRTFCMEYSFHFDVQHPLHGGKRSKRRHLSFFSEIIDRLAVCPSLFHPRATDLLRRISIWFVIAVTCELAERKNMKRLIDGSL